MLLRIALFIYLQFQLLPGSLFAQKNWVLRKDKDGIQISTRSSNQSKFNDIKVEMDLPGTILQLAAILTDVDKYSQWAYSTGKSMLIKRITPHKLVYYSEFNAPWPAMNRDLYAVMEITTDSIYHLLKVVSVGEQNYQPPKRDLVRIPYSKGLWNVTTVSGNVIHLIYVVQIDPGGSIPAWIVNIFSTKAPMETFKNLKNKMASLNKPVHV
jgi:hypothetical protein